jgi:hypothetical protein
VLVLRAELVLTSSVLLTAMFHKADRNFKMCSTTEETAVPLACPVLSNDVKDNCFPCAGTGNRRHSALYK